jgi:hypothetical protein
MLVDARLALAILALLAAGPGMASSQQAPLEG